MPAAATKTAVTNIHLMIRGSMVVYTGSESKLQCQNQVMASGMGRGPKSDFKILLQIIHKVMLLGSIVLVGGRHRTIDVTRVKTYSHHGQQASHYIEIIVE